MRGRSRDLRAALAGGCVAALLTVALVAPSSRASAQETGAVELVLMPVAARGLDVERVRIGLAEELGGEVRVRSTPHRRAGVQTIVVRSGAGGRLSVELARGDGTRMSRDTVVPMDPEERAATIVIVAANMLRDEASELLAMLRRAGDEGDEAAAESAPVEESAAAIEMTAMPDGAVALVVASSASVVTAALAAPRAVDSPSPASVAASALAVPLPDEAPGAAFLRLGTNVQLGSVGRPDGGYDLTLVSGFELAWTPEPFFAIGVRDVTGGFVSGIERAHYGGAPFAELAWALIPELALHGQLGVQLQGTSGGSNAAAAGVAPFLVLGARFPIIPELSIAIETALRVVASDGLLTQLQMLPQGAVLWTGGLSLLFHIS